MNARSLSRITVVSALTVGFLPFGTVVGAETVRLSTQLGGFSVNVEGAPFKALVDDPKAAVPRPTGTAVVEGDPNFTLASTTTGPNTRAVGSTVWPGNLFGEGLAQVGPGLPSYPLKAEARYPDTPYAQDGQFDGGQLSHATALGLDAFATASGAPKSIPGQVSLGDASSTSTTTVTDKNIALGTVVASVTNVDLVGVIHIGSVKTELNVQSNGTKGTSSGHTTVSGVTVAGQGYTVDETGAHAGGQGGGLPPVANPDPLALLGITFSGVTQKATTTGATAARQATGLIITIDTLALKTALAPALGPVKTIYSSIISNLPPDQQGNFYYLINATPKLSFVLGSASASSAAVLPLSFDNTFPPPAFPESPAYLPNAPTNPILSGNPGSGGLPLAPAPLGAVDAVPVTGAVPPVVLRPSGAVSQASASSDFAGIQPAWLLLALGASGLLGWLLIRFLGLVVGLPLGLGCRLGAPTSLPNFRSVTT
jgi:hypothetical protein